jgi:hypothetical protein
MGGEATTGALALTGDVIAGGAALAGLILVYLGNVTAGYAGFDAGAQRTVRASFQRRAWFAVAGIALAIGASGAALIGKWLSDVCLAGAAAVLLALALIWAIFTAVLTALEVR